MKLSALLLPAGLSLALSACVIDLSDQGPQTGHPNRPTQNFECQNGFTVTLSTPGSDRIVLDYGLGQERARASLTQAPAASGERYVSQQPRLEWHEKGGQALFSFADRQGNITETACQAR